MTAHILAKASDYDKTPDSDEVVTATLKDHSEHRNLDFYIPVADLEAEDRARRRANGLRTGMAAIILP